MNHSLIIDSSRMKIDVIPTGTEPCRPTVFPLNGQACVLQRGVLQRSIKLWSLVSGLWSLLPSGGVSLHISNTALDPAHMETIIS